jgi:Rrf2 family protein
MHLSKTSKYAIKLLTHMAIHSDEQFRSKELCQTLEIPYKYLSSIITNLSKAGIIHSSKGRNGGITFSKPLEEITLQEIIDITENTTIHECVMGFGICKEDDKCVLHDSWKTPKESVINDFLSQTLLDIKNSSDS